MIGLSAEQWEKERPSLSHENAVVVQIWNFCDGWNPQALPLALAYFDVEDTEMVIDLLLALRLKVEQYAAAQRGGLHG